MTWKVIPLLLLLAACLCYCQSDECNPPCKVGRGLCQEGKCVCGIEYYGEDCSSTFRAELGVPYYIYLGYALFISVTVFILSAYLMTRTIRRNIRIEISQRIALGLMIFGSFSRSIFYVIMAIPGVYEDTPVGIYVLCQFFISSYMSAYILQIVIWAELYNSLRSEKLQSLNVTRARTAFIVISSVFYLLDIATWVAVTTGYPGTLLLVMWIIYFTLVVFFVSIGFLVFGGMSVYKINKMMNNLPSLTKRKSGFSRVSLLTGISATLSICLLLWIIAFRILWNIQENPHNRWVYAEGTAKFLELLISLTILWNYHYNVELRSDSSTVLDEMNNS